jgi:hypothetical protein
MLELIFLNGKIANIARFFSPRLQTSSACKTDAFLFRLLNIRRTSAAVPREIFLQWIIPATISFAKCGSADTFFLENLFPSFCV